ncbi:MAG: hypothetical protein ACTJGT_00510 [Microbacteriaceae bacterium]
MANTMTAPPRGKKIRDALGGTLAFLLLSFGLTTTATAPAQAAEGTPTEITEWSFQRSDALTNGNTYWLDVSWRAVKQVAATPPVSVQFDLPNEIRGIADSFAIRDAAGAISGECTVTEQTVTCGLDNDYVVANPNNIQGTFSMRGALQFDEETVTEPQERTIRIAGKDHTFTVTPKGEPGPVCEGEACAWSPYTDKGAKYGSYNDSNGNVKWNIWVPTVSSGAAWMSNSDQTLKEGLKITVTDHFEAPQTYVSGPHIYELSCMAHSEQGYEYPAGWRDVTEDVNATVSDDFKSVTFTSKAPAPGACEGVKNSSGAPESAPAPYELEGGIYVIEWVLNNSNHELGGKQTLKNAADIKINGVETPSIEVAHEIQMAGGSGGGDMNNALPTSPTINAAECTEGDIGKIWEEIVLPEGGFFTYEQSVDDNHLTTVIATPVPGATLSKGDLPEGWTANDDGTATWSYQLKATDCDTTVTPNTPTINPAECTVDTEGTTIWETVTQPDNGNGITYSDVTTNDEHIATITATLDKGHVFGTLPEGWTANDDGTATWSYQLKATDCDTTVTPAPPAPTTPKPVPKVPVTDDLATTGGAGFPFWVTAAAALLLLSGVATALFARRERSLD